ncbi:MAG: CheY-P-specific phosphatase CheC [Firmicutes bacterium]|jgi:chemotaxis protein CheC|nr:CheY-P-specific phosphatase CheC [Bacillota bacterium]
MVKQQIDERKLDILKELANIGFGNAVTSLSQMLHEEKISMDVPSAELVYLQDVPELLGGAELPVAGVYIESHGGADLTILFVLSLDSSTNLILTLVPGLAGLNDQMGISVLIEVGNIMTNSYLNALSFMTGLLLIPSPPEIAVDMSGAIISTVIAEKCVLEDEVVLIKTTLKSMQKSIEGHILILPDNRALNTIFTLLGIR